MSLRIEKLTECASGSWGHFVAVYKNEECLGTVMTDGTLTARECYESLKNNLEIDKMEKQHYSNLERSGL
jgi:hypothetical protein